MVNPAQEISTALAQIAFLDPTGLLQAVQTNLDRTVQAWARHIPPDAITSEIVEAADEIHRNHPYREIRAGDVAAILRRRKADIRRRLAAKQQATADDGEPSVRIEDLPADLQQQLNKHKPKGR